VPGETSRHTFLRVVETQKHLLVQAEHISSEQTQISTPTSTMLGQLQRLWAGEQVHLR
jgi:hypothetical protein